MNNFKTNEDFFAAIREVVNEKIPFNKILGLKLESIEKNQLKIKFDMKEEFIGNYVRKTLHGGVISSVIDVTGGIAAFISIYNKFSESALEEKHKKFSKMGTIDLRVDYLRPGIGDWFISTGYVLRTGNKVVVTRIELHNNTDHLIAVGTGSYIIG